MLERDVESYFKARVKAAGGLCFKWTSPGRAGVPDQIVFWPEGRSSFVELKRPDGGKVRVLQKLTMAELVDRGHDVTVICTTDQVDEFIKART